MVGKKEYAQINELLNARLDAKKVLIAVHRGAWGGNIIEGTVPSLELALKRVRICSSATCPSPPTA